MSSKAIINVPSLLTLLENHGPMTTIKVAHHLGCLGQDGNLKRVDQALRTMEDAGLVVINADTRLWCISSYALHARALQWVATSMMGSEVGRQMAMKVEEAKA